VERGTHCGDQLAVAALEGDGDGAYADFEQLVHIAPALLPGGVKGTEQASSVIR
jgi:hypothetical protein